MANNPREGFFGWNLDELIREFQTDVDAMLDAHPSVRTAYELARDRAMGTFAPKPEQVDADIARFLAYSEMAEAALNFCVDCAPTPEAACEVEQALIHVLKSRNPKA